MELEEWKIKPKETTEKNTDRDYRQRLQKETTEETTEKATEFYKRDYRILQKTTLKTTEDSVCVVSRIEKVLRVLLVCLFACLLVCLLLVCFVGGKPLICERIDNRPTTIASILIASVKTKNYFLSSSKFRRISFLAPSALIPRSSFSSEFVSSSKSAPVIKFSSKFDTNCTDPIFWSQMETCCVVHVLASARKQ